MQRAGSASFSEVPLELQFRDPSWQGRMFRGGGVVGGGHNNTGQISQPPRLHVRQCARVRTSPEMGQQQRLPG